MQLKRSDMHRYQGRGTDFLKDNESAALWADPGLGKTVIVLTAVKDMLDDFTISKALIIAPLRVANTTWPAEVKNWRHLKGLKGALLTGNYVSRLSAVNSDDSPIHVINRENVPWLVDTLTALRAAPYDCIVIDESSNFKDHSTSRFKALRKICKPGVRVIELTGSPTAEGYHGLWSQVFLMDGGDRLGKNITAFRTRYFDRGRDGFGYDLKPGADERIREAIADLVLVMREEDYLDMPEFITVPVTVELPKTVRPAYRELQREFLTKINDRNVSAPNSAALAGKLLQFANGAVYLDEDAETAGWNPIHTQKLDALEQIVGETQGEPLLVAYRYKHDVERIRTRFPQARVLTDDLVEPWNEGEVPMLLAHPASAAYGLNLQRGGHRFVWFGRPWSFEQDQQFEKRLHRQGQTKPVVCFDIVCKGTADEVVAKRRNAKDRSQTALLDALKEHAKNAQK